MSGFGAWDNRLVNDSIILRPLRRADYPAIAEMLRRMWYAEPKLSPSCARRLAMIDLHYSMFGSTSALLAQRDGKPVGIIATHVDVPGARSRRRLFNWHRESILRLAASLLPSAEGRDGLRKMLSLTHIDAKLLHGVQSRFDAEVVLFLVDESLRGCGIGRVLFDRAMEEFRKAGVRRYFLFTDTRCDIGFYDHCGLSRLRGRRAALYGDAPETFYLYEGQA